MTTAPAHSPIGGGGRNAAFARQSNLDAWVRDREYPAIHDQFFDAYMTEVHGDPGAVCDIGCSTGLLGRRIAERGASVVWADGDADATQRGIQAGVIEPERLWLGRFSPESWPGFCCWLQDMRVGVLVARRILCVLSDAVPADMIRDGLAEAGVHTIILEGQKVDGRSVQRNATADDQVAYLAPDFRLAWRSPRDVRVVRR